MESLGTLFVCYFLFYDFLRQISLLNILQYVQYVWSHLERKTAFETPETEWQKVWNEFITTLFDNIKHYEIRL